jgi:hypothetical protein
MCAGLHVTAPCQPHYARLECPADSHGKDRGAVAAILRNSSQLDGLLSLIVGLTGA